MWEDNLIGAGTALTPVWNGCLLYTSRHNGLIVFPPATEGEGLSGFVSIYIKSEGKLGPDLRLYAQQFQYMGCLLYTSRCV